MLRFSLISICVFIGACNAPKKTTDFQSVTAKKVATEDLIYIYQNRSCPDFSEIYKTYGFKIECGTDVFDSLVQLKNDKVVKKIDSYYGKGWFNKNLPLFITSDN